VWCPAAAARNRRLREARESARQAIGPAPRGASLHELRRQCRRRKRGPGAQKPPRWSAERRASRGVSAFTRVLRRTTGREAPRKRLVCRVMAGPTGAQRGTGAPVGAPPSPHRGGYNFMTRAQSRRGKVMCCSHGLFDIVICEPRRRMIAGPQQKGRKGRVSPALPFAIETSSSTAAETAPRSALVMAAVAGTARQDAVVLQRVVRAVGKVVSRCRRRRYSLPQSRNKHSTAPTAGPTLGKRRAAPRRF
jgi:hypothetical protein